jgi:hypothetical protein
LQELKIAKQTNLAKALEISHKLVQLRSLGVAVRCETAGSATAFILLLKIGQSLFALSAFFCSRLLV